MKEPIIWELELPEVDLEEVFQAEGADYSRRRAYMLTETPHFGVFLIAQTKNVDCTYTD